MCVFLVQDDEDVSRVGGSSIFTFQKNKRSHSMAQTGESMNPPRSHGFACIIFESHTSNICVASQVLFANIPVFSFDDSLFCFVQCAKILKYYLVLHVVRLSLTQTSTSSMAFLIHSK